MKNYQALIFDWDGTLADSTAQIVEAVQYACRQVGLPELVAEQAKSIIGLSLDKAILTLYPEADVDIKEQLIHHYRHHYFSQGQKTRLFADVQALLPMLHNRYILGVATGKSRMGLEQALDDTHTRIYFSATRTADECLSKPNPDMVLSLCREWAVLPENVLMIGDTTHDLLAAANAGADAVGVCTGAHTHSQLATAPNCGIFNHFKEICQWLPESP